MLVPLCYYHRVFPMHVFAQYIYIYIYKRERELILAIKICIGHCKSCLPRYTMNPIVETIHSFIETKWSLLAFWSSSICGYMHTYHYIVCHFAVRACLECAPHVQSEKGLVVLIWPATYSSRPGSHPFFGCCTMAGRADAGVILRKLI